MTNLDSKLKSRDIILPTKVHPVKAMVFPVFMYGCESWTRKKAEHRRIDTFELWCWRRLLRGPWTSERPNQSILKEINPEYSLEGLTLKLKLQYSSQLMWRAGSSEKTLMLGRAEGRRRGQQRTRQLVASLTEWTVSFSKLWEMVKNRGQEGQGSLACFSPWGHNESDMTQQLNSNNRETWQLNAIPG